MKKVLLVILALSFTISLVSCTFSEYGKLDEVIIDGEKTVLEHGDILSVSEWNGPEYYFGEKSLANCPELYHGITVGSDIETVLREFDIQKGEAIVNREISNSEADGTTDIIEEEYKNLDFFEKESVLDAELRFGYILTDWGYEKATIEKLENGEADLVFSIDFVGSALAGDEKPAEKEIIAFCVKR